jgi:hypothetical protein
VVEFVVNGFGGDAEFLLPVDESGVNGEVGPKDDIGGQLGDLAEEKFVDILALSVGPEQSVEFVDLKKTHPTTGVRKPRKGLLWLLRRV